MNARWMKPSEITEDGWYFGNLDTERNFPDCRCQPFRITMIDGAAYARDYEGRYYIRLAGIAFFDHMIYGPVHEPPKVEIGP